MMRKFNTTLFLSLLSLVLTTIVSVRSERWAEKNFHPLRFNDRPLRRLNSWHPEIICIGNSMLGENINKKIFDNSLSQLIHKPAETLFIDDSSVHSAWQYLTVKNQIAPSEVTHAIVLLFDYEDFFTRPEGKLSMSSLTENTIRKNMHENETVLYKKLGTKGRYFEDGFPYLYSQRSNIKRYLTASAVKVLMTSSFFTTFLPSKDFNRDPTSFMQSLLSVLFKSDNFKNEEPNDMLFTDRPAVSGDSDEDFQKIVERSFIPDILAYKDRYTFVFVLSNTNPSLKQMKESLKTYSRRLRSYLEGHGAYLIDMNTYPELQAPGLMHDSRHFSKGVPRELNTETLVKAISEQGILRR